MAAQSTINVMHFGARGDGNHDDTVAIQLAIDHSYTKGGIVFFPEGIYRTSQPLVVTSNIKLMGHYYKGMTDNGDIRGAEIRYEGTDSILKTNKTTGDGIIYGLSIENLRFNAIQKPDYALYLHNISEVFLKRVHINGGFEVGLYTDYYDIGTISESLIVECDVGLWIDSKTNYTAAESLNVVGCNFWDCATAIKANNLEGVNFIGNHFEYFSVAFHLINDHPDRLTGGMFNSITIAGNNMYSSNTTKYPDARVLKIESTSAVNVFTLEQLSFQNNRAFCKNTQHLIEIRLAKNTSSIKYLKFMHFSSNIMWGCKVSAIYSDVLFADLILENNDLQNGYMSGIAVPEFSGIGKVSGMDRNSGLNVMKGAFQLPATASATQTTGEIWFPVSGTKPNVQTPYGTKEIMLIDWGMTASRPTQSLSIGQIYFDRTLNKLLVWNGSNWQDTVHSLFTERTFMIDFVSKLSHQKADILLLNKGDTFYGMIELTVVGKGAASGLLRKVYSIGFENNVSNLSKSTYTELLGNASMYFALGEVEINRAGTMAKVTIANLTGIARSATLHIKALPFDHVSKMNLEKKLAVGSVYTNDTTLLPTPANSLLSTRGISATAIEAKNLRGIKVSVAKGAKSTHVVFDNFEPDANYGIFISTTWITDYRVHNKTMSGFDVSYGVAAQVGSTIDWLLVR